MTGALDTKMRGLAQRMINKFGKQVTIVRVTETFNPATGDTSTTETSHTVNATPPADYTLDRIKETLIQSGDTTIQIAAKDLDLGTPDGPLQSDKVEIDGDRWNIVQIGKVYSGELIALYILHLRR